MGSTHPSTQCPIMGATAPSGQVHPNKQFDALPFLLSPNLFSTVPAAYPIVAYCQFEKSFGLAGQLFAMCLLLTTEPHSPDAGELTMSLT